MNSLTINSSALPQENVAGHTTEKAEVLWTIRDVAHFVKCSQRHVGNLQRAGLPFIKVGHLTRFNPAAVKKWLGLGKAYGNGKTAE